MAGLDITHTYSPSDEMHERLWRLSMQIDAMDVCLREARMEGLIVSRVERRVTYDPW